jgi:hypothetical protein
LREADRIADLESQLAEAKKSWAGCASAAMQLDAALAEARKVTALEWQKALILQYANEETMGTLEALNTVLAHRPAPAPESAPQPAGEEKKA